MEDLAAQHCQPLKDPSHQLGAEAIEAALQKLLGWKLCPSGDAIERMVETGGYAQGLELVNAIAALAEAQNHHPDLLLTWPRVEIRLTTHDVGGVSRNDLIMAAKIELLLSAFGAE